LAGWCSWGLLRGRPTMVRVQLGGVFDGWGGLAASRLAGGMSAGLTGGRRRRWWAWGADVVRPAVMVPCVRAGTATGRSPVFAAGRRRPVDAALAARLLRALGVGVAWRYYEFVPTPLRHRSPLTVRQRRDRLVSHGSPELIGPCDSSLRSRGCASTASHTAVIPPRGLRGTERTPITQEARIL